MRKYNFLSLFAVLALCAALPLAASAHERRVYQIGGKDYTFVVGFLNEPVSVDDKAGVDLSVMLGNGAPTMSQDGGMDGPPAATKPMEGLDKTLKVEISAGSEKKVFDFAPAYGALGHYRAIFYPSIATAYTFRIFGKIDNTQIDLLFSCNVSGQAPASDSAMVQVSEGVMQKSKSGAFGCPAPKIDEIFPAQKVTLAGLDQQTQELATATATADMKGVIGIVLGGLGLVMGLSARMKMRRV